MSVTEELNKLIQFWTDCARRRKHQYNQLLSSYETISTEKNRFNPDTVRTMRQWVDEQHEKLRHAEEMIHALVEIRNNR